MRVPNAKQSPRLEDILNRGRPDPTWRDHVADWWAGFDLVGALITTIIVLLAGGLSVLLAFMIVSLVTMPDRGDCLASHAETILMPMTVGKTTTMTPLVHNVCDVWEYPQGQP